jgi:hypothetical protein
MVSSGMLHRVALLRTDVSEEPSASFIRVTRIGELGTTLAATSNRRTLRRTKYLLQNTNRDKLQSITATPEKGKQQSTAVFFNECILNT